MPITFVDKDPENLTLTITSTYEADIKRVWHLWADPRQLERWWGPPDYPATFIEHDLSSGGEMLYKMTGPEGEEFFGRWQIVAIDPPHRIEVKDVFANPDGSPNYELPSTEFEVHLDEGDSGTTMMLLSRFPSPESMAQLIEMGMEEGIQAAMGQIDDILTEA